MSKTNSYEAKARRQALQGITVNLTDPSTKKNFGSTIAQTGIDFIAGGLAGSYVGSLFGKHGLWIGVLATGASYYFLGSRIGASFGIGMVASGFVATVSPGGTNGLGETPSTKDVLKHRSKVFFDGLKARLFLDKLKSKKKDTTTTSTPTNGLGNVRYFTYPDTDKQTLGPGELDMSSLERIEQQIADSAGQYQQASTVSGLGELMEERLY